MYTSWRLQCLSRYRCLSEWGLPGNVERMFPVQLIKADQLRHEQFKPSIVEGDADDYDFLRRKLVVLKEHYDSMQPLTKNHGYCDLEDCPILI